MKAILVEKTDDRYQLSYKDVPVPTPKEDQVVVKNHFIGVNFADTVYDHLFAAPPPFVPGCESAGEVTAVGANVHDIKVGDRVAHVSFNAYSEYSALDAKQVAEIPDTVSYKDAAAASATALTALTLVRDAHHVKKGDYILVLAAAGGVGLMLCQLGRYLEATVIGVVSSSEKAGVARDYGADHVINSTQEDVVAKVKEITNGLGCHAVFDAIGKATFETSFECVRRNGTFVSYGMASGDTDPLPLMRLAEKNVTINRPALYQHLVTQEERERWWGEMFDLLGKGHIKAHIYKTYDLKDTALAHQEIKSRGTVGKLLLKPSAD